MSIQGLDVSDDQGVIRWPNVAASGYSFGIAKASEGVGFTTWSFGGNWKGMQSAGLVRGAYHFSRVANDPVTEADFFLSAVGPLSDGDLLALDLEDDRAVGDIAGYALAFLDECYRQTGVRPFWYSYPYYIENHGLVALFNSPYPAWLVNPLSSWPDTLLQLLNGGFIDGIQGPVDLDNFAGTTDELLAYGKGGSRSTFGIGGITPGGFLMALSDAEQAELLSKVRQLIDRVGIDGLDGTAATASLTQDEQANYALLQKVADRIGPKSTEPAADASVTFDEQTTFGLLTQIKAELGKIPAGSVDLAAINEKLDALTITVAHVNSKFAP